jgi:hypothetical protein
VTEPPGPPFDTEGLDHLLAWTQSGVISRRQILELHGTDHDIARMVRRRQLVAIHPGVYVNHTGEPSRHQLEWAAVLHYWPAALTRESALPTPCASGRQVFREGCATVAQIATLLERGGWPGPFVRCPGCPEPH